jgi:alpha-L-arabinofuranosidase
MKKTTLLGIAMLASGQALWAAEYHVSPQGDDGKPGTAGQPLRTISAAAKIAQPGDVITVHEGIYRERIAPPRGGESDAKRIVYQAASGEKVLIKGSEVVKGWERVTNDTWKVTLPDSYFGSFNPYRDVIHGDWFNPQGRTHHSGAVYLNDHWLIESAALQPVLNPAGDPPLWYTDGGGAVGGSFLLNVAWIRTGRGTGAEGRVAADKFAAQRGIQAAPCSEGGQCIGWIEDGDWVRYDGVDFGSRSESMEFRAASVTQGGRIEVRLEKPDGELLGACDVPTTGDWQKWDSFTAKIKPTSGAKNVCLVFRPPGAGDEKKEVTIWAQFKGVDPNEAGAEINVRQTVFTPEKTGVDYITVRGFTLRHAATPWAPPTAGQIGLVSAYWCKGWIIENNDIGYSRCSGVALGKYSDEWDNRAESAEGYVGTLTRALTNGWNKATVGSHIVRNNRIHHCEQTGIVGSLGCSFSTVTGNEIHDIYVIRHWSGAEMAGIKFHGAIDVEISGNHIYRSGTFAIWLDWMAQGTHVTGNLLHDNAGQDLFMEVDHGPFLVANNLFLSRSTLLSQSQGGAFAHNLICGNFHMVPFDGRMTPLHKAHSTEVAKLHNNPCGDFRYYNNLLAQGGDISPFDKAPLPSWMAGNVFTKGARGTTNEVAPLLKQDFDPQLKLTEKPDGWYLELVLDKAWGSEQTRKLVTTELLGRAKVPDLPFENADGTPCRLDTDYFGKKRDPANPFPGPFELPEGGRQTLKVWPVAPPR